MKKFFPLLLAPLLLLSGCAQKETSSAQNNTVGDMTIALDTLGETPAFADGTIDGQPMQVIAVRDSDGAVRLSYNTCQVCQGSPASLSARTAATLFPFPLSAKAVTAACR